MFAEKDNCTEKGLWRVVASTSGCLKGMCSWWDIVHSKDRDFGGMEYCNLESCWGDCTPNQVVAGLAIRVVGCTSFEYFFEVLLLRKPFRLFFKKIRGFQLERTLFPRSFCHALNKLVNFSNSNSG